MNADAAPDALRLVDGELKMADGSSAEHYLREWAKRWSVDDTSGVCIVRRSDLQRLLRDLSIMYSLCA